MPRLIAVFGLIRLLFVFRDAITFVGPLAEVYQLAAFAAKRAITVFAIPHGFLAALRAGDYELLRHGYSEQKVRLNSTS